MTWALDKARQDVDEQRRRCKVVFDQANHCHLGEIIYACWGYAHEVERLHEKQALVARLEAEERHARNGSA